MICFLKNVKIFLKKKNGKNKPDKRDIKVTPINPILLTPNTIQLYSSE